MSEPQIISSFDPGLHNRNLPAVVERLDRDRAWRDLSTIQITPAGTKISTKIVAAWENVIFPPNNRVVRLTTLDTEVGVAYSHCIEMILAHPELSTWKYILTREHDMAPPPDGLVKLLRRMEDNPQYAAISGLYFTKNFGGVAQCWGDPNDKSGGLNFRPQPPRADGGLLEVNGIGMGWAVWRLKMFHDPRLRRPWFKTTASSQEGVGTQDLHACSDFRQHGYRVAVDCDVKVGHWDDATQTMF